MFPSLAFAELAVFVVSVKPLAHTLTTRGDDASGLSDAAKARGRDFGTAVHNAYLQRDATYSKFINDTHEFGQLVPEASMKWDQIQPK